MVSKHKSNHEESASDGPTGTMFDRQFASSVKDSAQQIWQAGLAAFAKAQGEGSKVFESLVKEGVAIQRKTQAAAEERFGDVTARMTTLASDMQQRAGQHWDRLETIFEDRVAKALGRLGVPTQQEIAAMNDRIAALQASVARLEGDAQVRTTTRKPRTAAAKRAARPSADDAPARRPSAKSALKSRSKAT